MDVEKIIEDIYNQRDLSSFFNSLSKDEKQKLITELRKRGVPYKYIRRSFKVSETSIRRYDLSVVNLSEEEVKKYREEFKNNKNVAKELYEKFRNITLIARILGISQTYAFKLITGKEYKSERRLFSMAKSIIKKCLRDGVIEPEEVLKFALEITEDYLKKKYENFGKS